MDILSQAKSGMGKTAVFVLATLQQIEPVDGQVRNITLINYNCTPVLKNMIKSIILIFLSRSLCWLCATQGSWLSRSARSTRGSASSCLQSRYGGFLFDLKSLKRRNVHLSACIAFWYQDVQEKVEVGVANAPADGA